MKNLSRELREAGYKATPGRLAILDIFIRAKVPLDAEMVSKKLEKQKIDDINEVTVYRTLASFQKSGILRRVDLRKDSVYFELEKNHHHHIVCTNCESVEDFKNKEIEKFLGRIVVKSSKFKTINEHALELFGLCASCA